MMEVSKGMVLQVYKNRPLCSMFNSTKCNLIYRTHQQEALLEKGHLFLGSVGSLHGAILKGNRIGAVLSVLQEQEYLQHQVALKMEKHDLRHLWINAKDSKEVSLNEHFEPAFSFISKQLEEGNVLVHCQMGKSRSASIVIAFLIKHLGIPVEQAYSMVQQKRPLANPNSGFRQLLLNYEKTLKADPEFKKEEIANEQSKEKV